MKKTVIKILTITAGILAALAAVAGVVYLIQKKTAGKCSKKYVSCPQDDDVGEIDEICECDEIEDFEGDIE